MLDWFPNADHVGLYQALADGDFTQAGLDVHVQVPSDPATPLQLLAAGKVDVAISYEPELLLARDKGEPLVAVARDRAAAADLDRLARRPSTSPARPQLRGKTVGDAGIPYQHAYLKTILEQRRRAAAARSRRSTSAPTWSPAMLSGPGRRDARRVLELRGDPAAPGWASAPT